MRKHTTFRTFSDVRDATLSRIFILKVRVIMSTELWDYDNDIEDKSMHVSYFYIVKLNIF